LAVKGVIQKKKDVILVAREDPASALAIGTIEKGSKKVCSYKRCGRRGPCQSKKSETSQRNLDYSGRGRPTDKKEERRT